MTTVHGGVDGPQLGTRGRLDADAAVSASSSGSASHLAAVEPVVRSNEAPRANQRGFGTAGLRGRM